MIVLLNALPLNSLPGREILLRITRTDIEGLKRLLEKEEKIECFIRHQSTVEVLNKIFKLDLKPSGELYKYQEGDQIIVISLKKPIRGREIEVKPEDLEFFIVSVEK